METTNPPPFTNQFIVDLKTSNNESINIQCFDIMGQKVLTKTVNTTTYNNQVSIDMDAHPAGIYYLRIEKNGELMAVEKIIKI